MSILDSIRSKSVDRRVFIAGAAAACAALTMGGCENTVKEAAPDASSVDLENGEWVPVRCYNDCGGCCSNWAYVVDGVVVRQKTDDLHEDSPDFPQQRGCPKGRSMRRWVYGADRLRYPMKRKHWEPGGGGGDVTLRGRDDWERMSWDDAIQIAADELKRIMDTYGNRAIVGYGLTDLRSSNNFVQPPLQAMGGCTTMWGQQSYGAVPLVKTFMIGSNAKEASDRYTLRKSKLIVIFAHNPSWSSPGNSTWFYAQAKQAGAKIVVIDPWFSPSAQAIADQWIPIRPGSDSALLCALAYHMIVNNLQDQEFLDTYCVGFDAGHMPEGYESGENFKDYILGAYDGLPKTPEWASAITGIPAATIEDLAYRMATVKPMSLRSGLAMFRTISGAQACQLFLTVGWMTGNVGLEGGEVLAQGSKACMFFGGSGVELGTLNAQFPKGTACTGARGDGALQNGKYKSGTYYGVANAELWSAILTGKMTDFERGESEVTFKCLTKLGRASINQLSNHHLAVEALRTPGKLDFVLVNDKVMNTDALFADMVFPICTNWENDYSLLSKPAGYEALIFGRKVIEPLFESRSDDEFDRALSKAFGLDPEAVIPVTTSQLSYGRLADSVVTTADGGREYLCTVTEKDISEHGLDGLVEPHEGKVSMRKVIEDGGYQAKRYEGDAQSWYNYQDYRSDPENHPLKTSSGKFEIYCPSLAEYMKVFNSTPIDPCPKYVPDAYEQTFDDWQNRKKSEYRFQLATPHHIAHSHSAYVNNRTLNEIHANNLVMNTLDAAELGVENGDTVLVSGKDAGQILRRVNVSPRVLPGVVIMGEGNWTEIDEETGIDFGGNVNTLLSCGLIGQGHQPYNSIVAKIEKWEGEPLTPDYLRPMRELDEEANKLW